jgi:low affinity Fe/Cu permease
MFGYSDTWQLVINTGTTIITFLMVFLIQNTQNRDAKAIHLKLDEMIKATPKARNHMIDLDKLSDEQLKELEAEYKRICEVDESGDGAGKKAVEQELVERESR